MVRDLTLPEKMRAEGKALIDAGTGLVKEADRLERINRGGEMVPRQSVNWKTADSLEEILKDGKHIKRAELEEMLVKGGHVQGQTEWKKRESAKLAITLGLAKGYLIETSKGIAVVPGARKSKVRKKV